jgi:hypothetical protein
VLYLGHNNGDTFERKKYYAKISIGRFFLLPLKHSECTIKLLSISQRVGGCVSGLGERLLTSPRLFVSKVPLRFILLLCCGWSIGWGEMAVSAVFMNALLQDSVDERYLQISVRCLIGYLPGRVSNSSENF